MVSCSLPPFAGFSYVVWEMATLTKPFESYNRNDFIRSVIVNGERPAINRQWPKGFSDLLQDCWKVDPNERPVSFSNERCLCDKD